MSRPPLAIAVSFVALGTYFGTWAVVAADIERALGIGHGAFGALLAGALVGTAVAGAVTGSLVERWGVPRVLAGGCVGFTLGAVGIGVTGGSAPALLLGTSIVFTYTCSGVVDVAMNVAAAATLADDPGRLVRFHGLFNAGAAAGAGATAVLVNVSDQWRLAVVVPALAMSVSAVWCVRSSIPAGESGEHHGLLHAMRTVQAERLQLLAAVFAFGAMVEGGIETWGVLVLREQLDVGILVGAAAYLVGQSVAALARATLGPAAGALGTVRGIAIGSGLAAGGLLLVSLAPTPLAVFGLVLGAAGVSVCWPMLLAHASSGLARPAGVVSGVTAIGYLGFVVGPAVIGLLADVAGLRGALLLLAVVAAGVAVAPRWLRPASRLEV